MPGEYGDEREGYEEDHSDRNDYPEYVRRLTIARSHDGLVLIFI